MTKRKNVIISLIVLNLLFLNHSCKKEIKESLPVLTTSEVSNITFKSATTGGTITNSNISSIDQYGVCWSLKPNPTINDSITIGGFYKDGFICKITNLKENTRYFVRSFATNIIGTGYGEEFNFSTIKIPAFFIKYDVDNYTYKATEFKVEQVLNRIQITALWTDTFLIIKLPINFTTGEHNLKIHGSYEAIFGYGNARQFHSKTGTINIIEHNPETLKIHATFNFLGKDLPTGALISIKNGEFVIYF